MPILMPAAPSPSDERYMFDDDHHVIPATNWAEWCKWMAGPQCPRWMTEVPPTNVRVFTFFAGMPNEHGAFFWTNITSGRYHGRSGYAFTYAEARAQHDRVVAWLRKRYQARPTEE